MLVYFKLQYSDIGELSKPLSIINKSQYISIYTHHIRTHTHTHTHTHTLGERGERVKMEVASGEEDWRE